MTPLRIHRWPLLLLLLGTSWPAQAQTPLNRDPAIERLVSQINPDSLRATIQTLASFGTRHTLSSTSDPRRGIGAARTWVLRQFQAYSRRTGGRLQAQLDTFHLAADGRRINRSFILGNVVATLPGTDPADKRVFLVIAHLDSRASDVMDSTSAAPGANDDASGCAAVLECARVLSQAQFPATIVFATLSGEEQGLLGAYAMARRAKQQGQVFTAVLNNDIIGGSEGSDTGIRDNTTLRVFSEGLPAADLTEAEARRIRQLGLENDGAARQLARYSAEIAQRYVPNLTLQLVYRNDRFLRGGDHTAFAEAGFPAIRFCEPNEHYDRQHQDLRTEAGRPYGDLPEYIDYEYLRKGTAANLSVLANLAKAPAAPTQVVMDVRALTNTTTLRWAAPATGRAAGYYVLVRETTSPLWQHKLYVATTEATLPYSKDNYLFAVQAVSATGNESLPVVPSIGR